MTQVAAMAACFPEQFCASWVACPPPREPFLALADAVREVGAVLEVAGGQPMQVQDAQRAVAVGGGPGVAGGGEGEEVVREVQAGADHGDGLQGLEGGPRVERGEGLAGGQEGPAVRCGGDDRAVVDALDEAVAGLDRERGVLRERLRGQRGRGDARGQEKSLRPLAVVWLSLVKPC